MVEKRQLKEGSNYMNKKVIIALCEDNTIELKCEDVAIHITDNKLSAQSIYELLNYQDGDKYSVDTEIKGTKVEILNPIKSMFDNLKDQINSLTPIENQVDKSMQDLEELPSDI